MIEHMMHHKVLIVLAALVGLYQLFIVKNTLVKVILAMQVLGIMITFLPIPGAFVMGFSIFILAGILAITYPFVNKAVDAKKKGIILLIAIPVVIANVFALCRFPGTGILGFTMIIPVIAYLIILFTKLKSYKNEIGFLSILAIDGLIKFLMSIEWQSFS